MAGLIIETQECYKNKLTNVFYCLYIDLASRHIDRLFVESMRFPPNDFFSDEEFSTRIGAVFTGLKMDVDTARRYLSSVTPVINQMVENKLFKQNSEKASPVTTEVPAS